jgi:hypothetical protein
MDIHKQVASFNDLPYDTRREKVTEMLKQLQTTHPTFKMFYETIIALNKVPDESLTYLYQSILEIAEELKVGNKVAAENKIQKMSQILLDIKRREEIDRQRE